MQQFEMQAWLDGLASVYENCPPHVRRAMIKRIEEALIGPPPRETQFDKPYLMHHQV